MSDKWETGLVWDCTVYCVMKNSPSQWARAKLFEMKNTGIHLVIVFFLVVAFFFLFCLRVDKWRGLINMTFIWRLHQN